MMNIEFKKVENGIIPIYESKSKEKLINARELFYALRGKETKTKFADWIKERLIKYSFDENGDYICFRNFTKADKYGNKTTKEYYLTIDTSKEICMIENNEIGRKIRRYFIEAEKRYKLIINNPSNIFDFMRLALNEIEKNENEIKEVKNMALDNKKEIEELKLYSENKIPHSNLIGGVARQLGYKISYKHYYEDKYIAIIKDISKNEYWQVYFKPLAVKEIINWFNKNKEEIYYEIQYIKNTKNGKRGEVKEKGYKIENICYKIQ